MTDQTQPSSGWRALSALPTHYRSVRRIEIDSFQVIFWLNIGGFVLIGVGVLLFGLLERTLPREANNPLQGVTPLGMVALFVIGFVIMLTVHELFHGLGFSVFGARPRYGVSLRKGVAFASAAHMYLPRSAYLVVALLPLAGISLISILIMPFVSGESRTLVILIAAANVGGAVGDLWFTYICLRMPASLLIRDFGEGAELYLPAAGISET